MKKIIPLLSIVALLSGCMGAGTISKPLRTMKNQTAIVQANTPWGPQRLILLNTNTSVVISPDGSLSINSPSPTVFTPSAPATNGNSFTVTPQVELRIEKSK